MQEEIFGPILPISEASSVEDVVDFINAQPSPLGVYLFSKNPSLVAARAVRIECPIDGRFSFCQFQNFMRA